MKRARRNYATARSNARNNIFAIAENHHPRAQNSRHARLTVRLAVLVVLAVLAAAAVATLAFAQTAQKPKKAKSIIESKRMNGRTAPRGKRHKGDEVFYESSNEDAEPPQDPMQPLGPFELHLTKAHEFNGDLRSLPRDKPKDIWRDEHEPPEEPPIFLVPPSGNSSKVNSTNPKVVPAAPAPTPLVSFDGLGRPPGNGFPPDTNGDVGPNHYIQTINTSLGIFNKVTGAQFTSLSFNTFMSQGNFGNLCDTNNFGDPVVLYDTFEDRWVLTDFAFSLDGSSNVINPPGSFQCFAVSKTGDPVAGGWNYYSIQISDALNDYPKFGIWPDGLYMTANMFGFGGLSGSFVLSREWAFNKAQMYAGAASPQIVSFDAPRVDVNGGTVFTAIPSNARLQTGTPPTGTPNYFAVTGTYTNALQVWKFHVDWTNVFASSFTGASLPLTGSAWISPPATVPSLGGNGLDTLATRSMMQNQYTNFAGTESLWLTHTVRNSTTAGVAAARWYQLLVTGGTVAANTTQAANHEPDTTISRFMPSIGIDRAGDTMLGYSASGSTIKPAIRYAGRLPGDTLSTLPQTETDLIQGLGTQVGNCGGGACTRWGDYSAMSLDPDGCTFWFTSEYYPADGLNYATRIGSFAFPSCTAIGNGTVSGTVTTNPGGAPISGATVTFGSRTTTTAVNGTYSFSSIPAGTYASIAGSAQGRNSSTTTPVVVTDGGTSVNDFALTAAAASGCMTDTTQADFSLGAPAKVDLSSSPGDATLSSRNLDQINLALGGNGVGITTTTWGGQSFTPTVSGLLTRADIALFCSGCTGTIPNLTLSLRATSANLPTGADLATGTITGFSSTVTQYYSVTFATPATLVAGTRYALIVRPTVNPSVGTYALTRSGSAAVGQDIYANGDRVASLDSGGTWTINTTGGVVSDTGFRTFMTTAAGSFVSAVKDNNPAVGNFPHWSTISWNAVTPANTSLQFQVAGSNNPAGPFNFVGPDGTAGTFYTTSPGSLFQFNNLRYLKYKAFFSSTDPAVTPTLNDVTLCFSSSPTAALARISGITTTADGTPLAGVAVVLNGGTSAVTITDGSGAYHFDNVDTGNFYTVVPALANYHFSPTNRSFSLVGNKTDAVFTAAPDSTVRANAIDSTEFFVRQQYLDFLDREPDQGGFTYWVDQINRCNGDAACVTTKRLDVSAAFFMSQEFQETGSFVYDLYAGALGRTPSFGEFTPDRGQVIGGANLEQAKTAFANAFVNRAEFAAKYPQTLSRDQFVDSLLQTMGQRTGSDLSSLRDLIVAAYDAGGRTRALTAGISANAFTQVEYNKAFVLMEYFGYLRRTEDQGGFDFWLNVLNTREPQNYRGMVCSFLTSTEYQRRFSTVVSRGNGECGR